MKKIYYSLTVFIVSLLTFNSFEANAQCAMSAFQAANVGQPPCGGNFAQTSVGSGTYTTMSVVAGAQYCISTCNSTWNTQLTGYNAGTLVFFNDNNGPFCQSNQASIQWTATFTGALDIMVNQSNCLGYVSGGTSAILQYKQCTPTITSSSADLCPGQCVNLTADQAGGTWSISPNDGSLSGTNFCPVAVGTYTITYTLAACSPSQIINVSSPSIAPTSAVASPASLCPGGSATLSVSGGALGNNSSWQWYTGSCGGTPAGTGSSIVVSPSSTTTYYVRAEGGCGPTSCATVTVPVNNLSTAPTSVTATNTTLCSGAATTLTVIGGSLGSGSSWYWYNGSCGGILVGSGTSITVNPLSSTTYYVRAEGPCNVTTCVSQAISVTPAPQAGFSNISTPSACGASDGCISVVANGGTSPYSYSFNGVNSSATVCNLAAGPYVIVVTDASGCQDITSVALNDPGSTPATITSSEQDNTICQGDNVTFTASGSYLYNYYVNGNFVTNSNPWTTSTLNDGDIVNVVAIDYNFCSYTTLGITMIVHPNPSVSVAVTDPTSCGAADGSVITTVSGGQPNYNFAWAPNTSETTSTAYGLVAGPYFVTVSDQNGCSGTAISALNDPGAAPVVLVGSDIDSTICAGENIDFTATGSVNYTFFLNGTPVLGPSTTNIYSTVTLANNDVVIALGTDINNCTATSNYVTTTVNPGPTVTIVSSDPDNSICVGDMITFTGTGAMFYEFFINGVSQGAPGTLNVISSTAYNHGDVFYVQGTDANHCIVSSNSITLTVNPPPTVSLTIQQDPSSCGANDGLVIVTASGGTPSYNYEWNSNPGLGNAPNLANLYAGPYYVEVTDDAGCSGSLTATLSDVGSSPTSISSSDNDNTICEGEPVTFTASGATTYVFYIDGVVVSTNNPFTTSALEDGQGVAVVGLDTLLCAATSSVINFTVYPAPHISIVSTSNPSDCGLSDGSINTQTLGGTIGSGYNYTWNGGAPNAPDNTGLTAGSYTVVVTDANGCTDQASASLSDFGAPLVTLTCSDPDLIICQGDTVTFTAFGANTYDFFVNGPPSISQANPYQNWALANNDVVSATGTDLNGCTGTSQSLTFAVTAVVVPTLTVYADVCENVDQIILPGLAGESPSGGTFTTTYNGIPLTSDLFFPYGIGDGTHTITYSYDNGNGCVTSANADINVLPSPVVDLGADIEICDSAIIVAPTGYVSYVWFPNGETTESVVAYNSANYSVDVVDNAGCVGTGEVLAVINHAPQIEITASGPTEICLGDTVQLCIAGNWSSILWTSGSSNVSCIDVYQTGNYGVSAEDPNGCADEILEGQGTVVTVHNPLPIVNVLCDEFITTQFETYQWYLNGSPAAGGTFQSFHGDSSGNYYVVVTDEWGCTGQSPTIEHTCCCVGINEHDLSYVLDIFPNPTNGVFTVNGSFEMPVDMRLELTNILGQPVIPVEDVKNTAFIKRDYNLNHLAQGIYIFTIRTQGETIVRRVVKN